MTLFTIGVFGSTREEFFGKLRENKIDTFIDIRRRRAVRGAQYAFVNSKRLQAALEELGIRYLHGIGLAPTDEIRNLQKRTDAESGVATRKRSRLSEDFIKAYENKILAKFDAASFIKSLKESGAKNAALFCVEKKAQACHRSLVAARIREELNIRSSDL